MAKTLAIAPFERVPLTRGIERELRDYSISDSPNIYPFVWKSDTQVSENGCDITPLQGVIAIVGMSIMTHDTLYGGLMYRCLDGGQVLGIGSRVLAGEGLTIATRQLLYDVNGIVKALTPPEAMPYLL